MNEDVLAITLAGVFTMLAIVASAMLLGGIAESLGGMF